jgi:hypothetical protein
MTQNTVTTDSTTGGSLTVGNGYVQGHFGADVLYAGSGLVGGNVSTNSSLLILSNSAFRYTTANLFSVAANTTTQVITAAVNTFTITSNTVSVTSNTVSVTGNSTFSNTITVTGAAVLSNTLSVAGDVTFLSTAALVANGSVGTSGQVLSSNGTGIYWSTPAATGVTNVASGNGLSGGPITSTGSLLVVQGTGTVVNTTGVHVNSSMFVNTSAAYTITGVHTYQTNVIVGNTTVNTQHSNSVILISNSTSTTSLGLTNIRVGNTATNVIISNTTSTFGGNVVISGSANVTANLTISATGELIISNGAGIQANGTFGTSGQVLSSNGTGVYWANVAASGGSGLFNTSLTASVGFAANSTLSPAFTAPGTAGLRYIVYSIHVTNIGTANSGVTAKINGATYANVSLATTVPLPVESAVELLKMPKVMQPSDVLSIQVQDNTPLHATITYETQTSTNLFGAGVDITADATFTDLYTASGNAVIQSVLLSNDDGVNDVKARVVWTDGSNNIQGYYCYDLIIPADATVEILEQAKYLPSGFKIRVYANVGNRLEAAVSGRLI